MTEIHSNIRAFHSSHITVNRTMNDLQFWNVGYFKGLTMNDLQTITLGGSSYPNAQSNIDGKSQTQLDGIIQQNLDSIFVDNEQWSVTSVSGSLTLIKDPTRKFSNLLQFTLSGTGLISGTLNSIYNDDLITPFNASNSTYYIDLLLRGTPAAKSLLVGSGTYIDFTNDSSGNYTSSITASLPFSSAINWVPSAIVASGTQDLLLTWNRNQITATNPNIDLSSIKQIRFRVMASGTGAYYFQPQALRLYELGQWDFPITAIDTKRGTLRKSLPQQGNDTNASGPLTLLQSKQPKNVTHVIKFNSGTLPSLSSGTNNLNLYYRYISTSSGTAYDQVSLYSNLEQTIISMYEIPANTGKANLLYLSSSGVNSLTANTDYLLKTELSEDQFKATIYESKGVFYGNSVMSTGWISLQDSPRRGLIGYQFWPYHYDFSIDYMRLEKIEYGRYQSKPFSSLRPVIGAKLQSIQSNPIILSNSFQTTGDSYNQGETGQTIPGTLITRSGTSWYGGYITTNPVDLYGMDQAYISGQIYPYSTNQGEFNLVLMDENGLIGFIQPLTGLVSNKWNTFNIRLSSAITPECYYILIQEYGFSADKFEIQDVQVVSQPISWSISNNNNVFQPFLGTINDQHNGLVFDSPGQPLTVRAIAHTDTAWIQNYKLEPIYKYDGAS